MSHTGGIKHARTEREAELMAKIERLTARVDELETEIAWTANKAWDYSQEIERLRDSRAQARIVDQHMIDEAVKAATKAKNGEIEKLREQLEVVRELREYERETIRVQRDEIVKLQAERDRYKGTLRFLAGEGITVARNALERKP